MRITQRTLEMLRSAGAGLDQLQRGLEKESLRVAADGSLSKQRHPKALGSALTHEAITTDFSVIHRPVEQGDSVLGTSLGEDVADVIVNRPFADGEPFGDLLVGQPFCHKLDDFNLPCRE